MAIKTILNFFDNPAYFHSQRSPIYILYFILLLLLKYEHPIKLSHNCDKILQLFFSIVYDNDNLIVIIRGIK